MLLKNCHEKGPTYIDNPSSLIIYPIPYPSAATGPNPNSLNAGFPQFDVDKIDVLNTLHPGSVNIDGSALLFKLFDDVDLPSSEAAEESSSSSRCTRQ